MARLLRSLVRQERVLRGSVLLTPVDSIPAYITHEHAADFLQGLYVTDKQRPEDQLPQAKVIFGGRGRAENDIQAIYRSWANLLRGPTSSMRLLSGLHAYVVIFMALGKIGDTILVLPETAGGHFSANAILTRLGFRVLEAKVDYSRRCIDIPETMRLINLKRPSFLLVDRSEGLSYENFSRLAGTPGIYSVFDASQYLPQIAAGIYPHPFEMGFDLLVSTLHKSFPGPQKAIVLPRKIDHYWETILKGLGTFVSSIHVKSVYLAGLALGVLQNLPEFAETTLTNATCLDARLRSLGVPVVDRVSDAPATQHIWIKAPGRKTAYFWFQSLTSNRLLTNYRLLPYRLGHGIRIGTSAATLLGLSERHLDALAACIADTVRNGKSLTVRHRVRELAEDFQGLEW